MTEQQAPSSAGGAPAGPTYEQAREELASVVAQLERGGLTLEESLALWERGEALGRTCDAWLASARQRLDSAESEGDE